MTGTIQRLLADRIGLDPSTVGDNLITRGIQARMAELGLRDRGEYETLLSRSEAEQQALVEEVVIPESWFFRDDRPFRLLKERALAGWACRPERPPLRALSLPCAGGEEAYSIAISLLDAGLPPGRFRVDAVDVSRRNLDRARAAIYGSNSFRGGQMPGTSPHFCPVAGGMAVAPEARSTVAFHLGNILDPSLLADVPPYDMVFCRNLLIYFDPPSRVRAFANLDRLLADSGILFLGHADRTSDLARFEPIDDRGCFAFRRSAPAPPPADPPRPYPPGSRPTPKPVAIARPAPAPIPESPHPAPPPPAKPLEEASALADQGQYDEATRLCERAIRAAGPSARAYFLLGMIRQAAGDRSGAEAHLQRAVYLDGQHDEALLALAILARRRGDVAAEAGYRRRAERARSRKGTS
ncbi:CheR family methyltransferase (plasmid) [Tundrisphaera sp. TA3]|uniref:CheR family methyltransferase n=1 Tax=Tundrisphaera sp. TA3 TaxID=3435775 RepID=UPI003EB71E82